MPRWAIHYDGTLSVHVDASDEDEARAVADDIADEAQKMIEAAIAHLDAALGGFDTVHMMENKDTGEEITF